ncbi:MAG: hypothetical protein ACRCZQ_07525, partial [Bacteroidales bacterium]
MAHFNRKQIFFYIAGISFALFSIACSGKKERGPHTIEEFRGGVSKTFSDLNAAHLEAARSINTTIFANEEEADDNGHMVKIKAND